jgi:hypothetical protein
MPTLEELLRASLKGANDKYNQANKALHASVVETAKAVEAATDGKATVRLDEVNRDANETRYDLVIMIKGLDGTRTIANFGVSMQGFPIYRYEETGGYTFRGNPEFRVAEKFDSAEAITKYFQKLASDPDSSLVGYLAFIIRNSGDPIPF